jgi:hypothetical protein
MVDAIEQRADEEKLAAIRDEVRGLCEKFPIPESFT